MIQIEESNPTFESCDKCIYSDDSEETCILRRCIHAVSQLKECYIPKQRIEPQRKKGRWILVKGSNGKDYHKCSECLHMQEITGVKNYCAVCGTEMEGEG